jgi:heavy metal sensor kinase
MPRTLSYRLTAWYAGLFFVSSVILFAVTYGVLARSLQQRDRDELRAALKEYTQNYQRGGKEEIQQEVQETRRHDEPRLLVRLATKTNQTLVLERPAAWAAQFDLTQLERRDEHKKDAMIRLPALDGDEDVLEVVSHQLPAGMLLQVGKSTAQREHLLERYRETFLAVLLPMLLVSIAAGALLTTHALRPLRWLITTVEGIIATGTLTTRAVEPQTQDELRDVTHLFNIMLDRISLLISGMQGTLDTVAHDLRTPMTRLRGMAEMALQSDASAADLREALGTCLEESERILAMLNMLMDIAEAEHGAMRLDRTPVTAQSVVTQAVALYGDIAEEKDIRLSVDVPPDLHLLGDRQRLSQVVTNLLDNAVKYTPQGGEVAICAAADETQVVLTVKDSGVGIAPEDLPHIWDRLYRSDKSRSERGLGLGLSLVKAIVQAHGGDVSVSSTPGCGSMFQLTFPRLLLGQE